MKKGKVYLKCLKMARELEPDFYPAYKLKDVLYEWDKINLIKEIADDLMKKIYKKWK